MFLLFVDYIYHCPGVQTPNCIRQTVFDAVSLDYQHVSVISDATAAATPEIHFGEWIFSCYAIDIFISIHFFVCGYLCYIFVICFFLFDFQKTPI